MYKIQLIVEWKMFTALMRNRAAGKSENPSHRSLDGAGLGVVLHQELGEGHVIQLHPQGRGRALWGVSAGQGAGKRHFRSVPKLMCIAGRAYV